VIPVTKEHFFWQLIRSGWTC